MDIKKIMENHSSTLSQKKKLRKAAKAAKAAKLTKIKTCALLPQRREPNGRASRKDKEKMTDLAKTQPHRVGYKDPLNPLLGSPLGRLYHDEKITKEEYETGEAWLKINQFMTAVVLAPRPKLAILSLEAGRGLSCQAPPDPEKIKKIRATEENIFKKLYQSKDFLKLARALDAINQREVYPEELVPDLKAALRIIKLG